MHLKSISVQSPTDPLPHRQLSLSKLVSKSSSSTLYWTWPHSHRIFPFDFFAYNSITVSLSLIHSFIHLSEFSLHVGSRPRNNIYFLRAPQKASSSVNRPRSLIIFLKQPLLPVSPKLEPTHAPVAQTNSPQYNYCYIIQSVNVISRKWYYRNNFFFFCVDFISCAKNIDDITRQVIIAIQSETQCTIIILWYGYYCILHSHWPLPL